MEGLDGSIMPILVRLGNSTLMLCKQNPQPGTKSAKSLGGSPVMHPLVCD